MECGFVFAVPVCGFLIPQRRLRQKSHSTDCGAGKNQSHRQSAAPAFGALQRRHRCHASGGSQSHVGQVLPEANGRFRVGNARQQIDSGGFAFKPGRVVKVAVQPWEKVEGKYGGYNRREIDSDEAMSLDPYWGDIQK
jgi:hypothetical protein